jgi:hypothetical protein
MKNVTNKYVDIHGNDLGVNWNIKAVQNTNSNIDSSLIYAQRRIMSRLLAAANLIASVSRRGRGQFAVTNAHILSALQDNAAFVVAPMVNTLHKTDKTHCTSQVALLVLTYTLTHI